MKKRLLSIILTLALCLSLLPTAALAEGADDYYTAVLTEYNLKLTSINTRLDSRHGAQNTENLSDNGIYEIWSWNSGAVQVQAYVIQGGDGTVYYEPGYHQTTKELPTADADGIRFRLNVIDETHITLRGVGNAAPTPPSSFVPSEGTHVGKSDVSIEGKYIGWNNRGRNFFLSDEPVLLELTNDGEMICVSSGEYWPSNKMPFFRKIYENLSVKKVQTFTYDGNVHLPVVSGTSNYHPYTATVTSYNLYSMEYSANSADYIRESSDMKDKGFPVEPGSYTVHTIVKRNKDYEISGGTDAQDEFYFPVTVIIENKAQITKDAAPVTGLVYNGSQQALVRAAEGTGGTLMYRVNGGEWSASIPTAKNTGTYTVYYKVFGEEVNGVTISDSETKSVSVTIAKQALTVNSNEVKLLTSKYTGKLQTTSCLKNDEYGSTSREIPADAILYGGTYQATVVGEYTATVQPSSNYTWKNGTNDSVSLEWKITPRLLNLTGFTVQNRPYEAGNCKVTILSWDGTVTQVPPENADAQATLNEALKNGKLTIAVDLNSGLMLDDKVGTNKNVLVTATMTGEEEYLNGFKLNYVGGYENMVYIDERVEITKPEYKLIAPTAAVNLTYDSTEKTLLTAPASCQESSTVSGITYSYRLGTDGEWSDAFPTATDAGTYDVYYRANETDSYAATVCKTPVRVTIKPCEIALPTDDDLAAATYNGSEQTASLNESYEHRDKVAFTAGQVQTNADTYSVTLQPVNSNYIWPNGQTTCTLSWTISPKTIGIQWGDTAFTYNGSQQAPTATATGLIPNDTCTITVSGGETNAGTYTATATGVGNTNYTLPESGTIQTFSISPKAVTVTIQPKSSAYGTAIVELTATDNGIVSGETGVYTLSTTATSESDVGTYDITGTSNSTNYDLTFAGGTKAYTISRTTNTWTTEPAVTDWTYGEDAKAPVGTPKFGTVKVEYKVKDAEDDTYAADVPTNAGSYTVRFTVAETDNYTGLSATKDLTIAPKTIGIQWGDTAFTYNGSEQCPTATATELEDGDTCTITVTGGQTDAGNNYTATATKVDNPNYKLPSDNTTEFTISPKKVTAAPKDVTIIRGSAIPAFELTYTGLLGEDTLTPDDAPTFTCYEKDGTTPVSTNTAAGTYTITWANTDITFTGGANYQVVAATGTLTINNPIPTYPPTVEQPEGGSVSVSPAYPTQGARVTITAAPDEGYEVASVTVTDKDGSAVEITDNGDGTYSFTQPAGHVTVTVTFKDNTQVVFVDVPADAYYNDAVYWAVDNGITDGTDDTHFSPNAACTRAQAVTFLWRAAGCPEPKSTEMPFADVPADAYYHDAVLWAVEQGITEGTSDTTFSPTAVCTRVQIVTFLWRAESAPTAATANPFTDVAADAYYAGAVNWAVEKGVTDGTSDTTFSPNDDCTRGQIVTFLYRACQDR